MIESVVSSSTLVAALRLRYEPPEYCVDTEITLSGRRIDVVAFRLWGDNVLLGFELKVSRSDWLRELKQLEKSRDWARSVDQFFVVAPAGCVQDGELPIGWGLIEWRESGLRLKAQPHVVEAPKSLPREIAARLIARQQQRAVSGERAERDRDRHEIRAELLKEFERRHERDTLTLRDQLKESKDLLSELETLAGLTPREWNRNEKLRHFARTLSYLQQQTAPELLVSQFVNNARRMAKEANDIVDRVEAFVAERKAAA